MPPMVNVNRFVNMGAIPLVLVAYAGFIWVDHTEIRNPDIKTHMQNVGPRVDALVFGGSNAVFSLSAEQLTHRTGMNWYNASLNAELNSISQYNSFVLDLSARMDRTKVRYVVYSSLLPYSIGDIAAQADAKRVKGEGIKPRLSVLMYILQYSKPPLRSARNSFGDLDFEGMKCAFTKNPQYKREKEDISADFLVDKAIFFAGLFPNASILIVLPSEYYGVTNFDDSRFQQDLRTKFYDLLSRKYHFERMIKIIFQPPYSSITQVCNAQHHANELGRLWRTQNLIDFIR